MCFLNVLALVASVSALTPAFANSEDGYTAWMIHHKKNYSVEEVLSRYAIWQDNYAFVAKHNTEADAGQHSFRVGMNTFAAMTNEEYRNTMLKYQRPERNYAIGTFDASSVSAIPDSVDWRDHTPAVVSPIKDQGQCGSCWAFSAVEAMEAAAAIKTGTKVKKGSPQQLVDCVDNGADNCDRGGEMHDGYLEVIKQGGLDTEASYPYEGQSGGGCRFKKLNVINGTTNFKGYKQIKVGNETDLMAATAVIPTVSIAIDASSMSFQLYTGGVYNNFLCHNKAAGLDHGVAIVGYGKQVNKDYWLVRNSWGTIWGMEGYIKMSKDKNNQCGVATDATYPVYE
jgi:cathepsin L